MKREVHDVVHQPLRIIGLLERRGTRRNVYQLSRSSHRVDTLVVEIVVKEVLVGDHNRKEPEASSFYLVTGHVNSCFCKFIHGNLIFFTILIKLALIEGRDPLVDESKQGSAWVEPVPHEVLFARAEASH